MKYMGSKRRIAKDILPIMLAERKPGQWWVEPFVGGGNMIDKVTGDRLGNDNNDCLIALLKALIDGYIPPTEISRELYCAIKSHPQEHPKELVAFAGILCSFGAKWFNGYAASKMRINYAAEGCRSLLKQAPNIHGVVFKSGCYLDLEIPDKSLIYCDPPYLNTTKYNDKFNHAEFWDWCRLQSKIGHTVFISEYSAPEDFICVKEVNTKSNLSKTSNSLPRTERLFRYKHEII